MTDDAHVTTENALEYERMPMPPWHIGHVVRKIMEARRPRLTRTSLAQKAGKRPNTITNLLQGGRSDEDTIQAVCKVLNCDKSELYAEVERSNAGGAQLRAVSTAASRERSPESIDADQYAR